jgi:hypothetical protein
MAAGLGKNSAITLQLSKENYEALVVRHGQWIRWNQAVLCPSCVNRSGNRDPNCEYCGGDGIFYEFQKTRNIYSEKLARLTESIWTFDKVPGLPQEILRAVAGKEILSGVVLYGGKYVNTPPVPKGQEVKVDARISNVQTGKFSGTWDGYRVSVDVPGKSVEGGTVYGDITSVTSVYNKTQDETYTVSKFYRRFIEIAAPEEPVEIGDEIECTIGYVEPFRIVLLSQVQNRIDQKFLMDIGGSGIIVFPNEYDIAEGDVVSSLIGWSKRQRNIVRGHTSEDALPDFSVADVKRILGNDQTEYLPGEDFLFIPPKKIRWIGDSPEAGTRMNVLYYYHPAYKVLREFPNTRSSEDKLLPRRAAVSLMNIGGPENEGL